jgi:serine/threonine protein kinase
VEIGDLIAGRYRIAARRAAGGMAVVYRATDTTTGATVAIKVLRGGVGKAVIERFKREDTALGTLAHPAIVRVVDRGTTPEGESFLVEEWIDGPTLREHLRVAALTARESVAMARAIAAALGEAHARGVIHRDIKPGNLMLAGGSAAAVKVVDFGIARIADAQRLTRTGAMVGTVNYMAPEQARGAPDVDARADVFAVGVVLYECLAGRDPFRGATALSTRAKIIALDPRPLTETCPDLPPAVGALVARILAKDPADRPADGAALALALDALGDVPPVMPPPRSDSPEPATDANDDFRCVVMSAPASPLLGRTVDELREDVGAVSAAHGCTGAVMADGAALITAPTGGPIAARAVASMRAALELRQRWRIVPIAVAGGASDGAADRAIDRGASAIETATIAAVFGNDHVAQPFGVLIEPEVAALIGDGFEIEDERGVLRVVAERPT